MLKFFVVSIAISFILSPNLMGKEETFVGHAKDKDGKVQYIEKHKTTIENGITKKILTTYHEPDSDKEFARLTSDFSKNALVPELTYVDTRNNYRVESKVEGKNVQLLRKGKKRGRTVSKTKEFEINNGTMMSQGYHNFIVSKMDQFSPGQEIEIEFIAANKLASFDFKVRYTGPKKLKISKKEKDLAPVGFELEINSWLIGMFAPKLLVTYDKKSKRILQFKGITNILAANGDAQDLTIDYSY